MDWSKFSYDELRVMDAVFASFENGDVSYDLQHLPNKVQRRYQAILKGFKRECESRPEIRAQIEAQAKRIGVSWKR